SGIGRKLATTLAQEGYRLVINDYHADRVDATAYEIAAMGQKAIPLPGDAGSVAHIQELVDAALEHFGRLDIVIANAGLTNFGSFLEYEESRLNQMLQLNLKGSFFLAQRAAQTFVKQGEGGCILLMSSNVANLAYPSLTAYSMTKAGLQMLAKSLALELAPHRIRVNSVAPGATVTPRTLRDDPNYVENWSPLVPTGEVTQQEDIVAAVQFLISDVAKQINGQTLTVDGGWSVQGQYPTV
ncbi:MAG: SDR family oxidoreductase, partial [Bacteroidota bacterium]